MREAARRLVLLLPRLQPQLPNLHSALLQLLPGTCLELPEPASVGPLLRLLLPSTALLLLCHCPAWHQSLQQQSRQCC